MAKIKAILMSAIRLLKIELLAFAHFIAAIVASYFIYLFTCGEPASDVIRNMILATGGIGGFYALIIAKKRQDRFEGQVTLGQEQHKLDQKQFNIAKQQMFNERLGRGVELLSNPEVLFRLAGICVLNDLLKSSYKEQQLLIIHILTDFLHSTAGLKIYDKTLTECIPRLDRLDVELTVRILMEYTEEYNEIKIDNPENLNFDYSLIIISFDSLDLRSLDFSNTKFSNANFLNSALDNCNFSGSKIINSIFTDRRFRNPTEKTGHYEKINFQRTKFVRCYFNNANFYEVDFSGSGEKSTLIENQKTEIIETQLRSSSFNDCNLSNNIIDARSIKNNFISDSHFNNCNLHSSEFKSQFFHGVNLTECNMYNCKFKEINFDACDPFLLREKNIKTIFQNCMYQNKLFSL